MLAGSGGTGLAFAQEAETDSTALSMEAVRVTGSRIQREDITGLGPATVMDRSQIDVTGVVAIEQLLQRLPATAGFAGNQTNAYWTSNGYGTTQVNLRGLGVNRTLVLLNGRRVVSGGTGANSSVDLSVIPVSVIDRIEVLKDGASAIYGADAVAGVVNIITREFEGFQTSGRYGITGEGDGAEYDADAIWGIASDRGSLNASISYQKTEAVNMADRAPCSLRETAGSLECYGSSATIGGRARLADGSRVNFNQVLGGDGDFYEPYSADLHNFASFPYLNAVNPIERLTFTSFGRLNLTDDIDLFTEFLYTNRKSQQLGSPGSLTNIAIAAGHPTNPTGQDLILESRRLLEQGPRDFFQDVDTFRFVGGLDGTLSNGWAWEVAANYGRNTGVDGSTNIANKQRVAETLDTSLCSNAPGAAIPCADYLGYGDLTPEVLDYIFFTMRGTGGNEQTSLTADITGDLFELPAGSLAFAVGGVYRKEKGWRDPDPLTVLGIANTNQQEPISGEIAASEVYLELSAPLLADLPLVEKLTLDGAIRYSDYDVFGGDTNYKLGLDWQVTPALRARATFGTAFRVPSVPQLFGGVGEGNLTTTDPCSNYSSLPAGSVIAANCAASGVPAGYVQLGNTVLTQTGANPNLKPESAESHTIGVVWQPEFASGLTLTADYFNIEIEDAIRSIPGSTKLSVCYNSQNLSHPFCNASHFTRNPVTGEVNYLSAQPVNTGSETVSGVDLAAIYGFDLRGLDASLNANITYLETYEVTPFPGADPLVFDGNIGGGNGGFPEWRGSGSFSLSDDKWSAAYTMQWIGEATDFNAAPGAIGYSTPNVLYHNLQGTYNLSEKASLSIGVDNLFDESAPFIASWTDANTDTMTYDLMGRRFYMRLNYRWF
ncbi:TonB-dependent receptor [Hyphomonas sediminis]|uniref:TonB-dependent receptor n=1 Tax=Hyphomonas sediminis TaxID=2866160 RepID=UPI003F70BB1A